MHSATHRPSGSLARRHDAERPPSRTRPRPAARLATAVIALAAALTLAACGGPAGPGGPTDPSTTTYLLLDNAGQRSVSVMSSAGALADLTFEANVSLGDGVRPCGMAIGPNGRLYVTDFDGARVLVIDLDGLLDGDASSAARVATITTPGLQEPCGLAFDASGSMWIADRRGSMLPDAFVANQLLQFDASAVAGATGAIELTPVRSIEPLHGTTDTGPDAILESRWITWLGFDNDDRLWFTDVWQASINRIDAPGTLPLGLVTDVEPDMQLTNPAGTLIMRNPASLAFDATGNVYVGNVGDARALRFVVSRLPSDGRTAVEPDAILTFPISLASSPIAGPRAVTLDAEGALWAAGTNRGLYRVVAPADEDGDVTPGVNTEWTSAGFTNGATFVWTTRTTP